MEKNKEQILQELQNLLEYVPPQELRKTVLILFFTYLHHQDTLPDEVKKIAEDVWLLLEFVEKVEGYNQS